MKVFVAYCKLQTLTLQKFLFLSYGSNCSQPIRLEDFLNSIISRNSGDLDLFFCMSNKIDLELLLDSC